MKRVIAAVLIVLGIIAGGSVAVGVASTAHQPEATFYHG